MSPLLLARDFLQHSSEKWELTNVDTSAGVLEKGALVTSSVLGTELEVLKPADEEGSARKLSYATKLRKGSITFRENELLHLPPAFIHSCSTVFLGALVGDNEPGGDCPTKLEIALYLIRHMGRGSHLLIRSADGTRSIAYLEVNEAQLLQEARKQGTPVKLVSEFLPASAGEVKLLTSSSTSPQMIIAHPKSQVLNSFLILERD